MQGLAVEPTFACDDQVGVSDVAVEIKQVQEVFGPRGGGGAEQRGRKAETAGGTRARGMGCSVCARIPGAGEGDDKVLEPGVEFCDLGFIGPLLGPKTTAAPVNPSRGLVTSPATMSSMP